MAVISDIDFEALTKEIFGEMGGEFDDMSKNTRFIHQGLDKSVSDYLRLQARMQEPTPLRPEAVLIPFERVFNHVFAAGHFANVGVLEMGWNENGKQGVEKYWPEAGIMLYDESKTLRKLLEENPLPLERVVLPIFTDVEPSGDAAERQRGFAQQVLAANPARHCCSTIVLVGYTIQIWRNFRDGSARSSVVLDLTQASNNTPLARLFWRICFAFLPMFHGPDFQP